MSCNANHTNLAERHSLATSKQQIGLPNCAHVGEESYKPAISPASKDGNTLKISYRPLNDIGDCVHTAKPIKVSASSSFDTLQQNKMNSFEPEMTSTPMSLSRASSKNIPDVVQPATLNSLVHSAAYDTKDKYDGPVVKVTIQNPRPYTPLSSELPSASKAPGKTNEVLKKSSYSETTLTRLTCNSSIKTALLTEVRYLNVFKHLYT